MLVQKLLKKSDENKGTTTGKYKDGTYTGKGDPWQYGSEEAIVEIKDSKITSIILKRLDKEGKEVNYEDWRGQEVGGKVYPNLKQYRMDMSKKNARKAKCRCRYHNRSHSEHKKLESSCTEGFRSS